VKGTGLLLVLLMLAAAIFAPPLTAPPVTEVRLITEDGTDRACPPAFARVEEPARLRPSLDALVVDFSWAAAAAGPDGLALALAGMLAVVALTGMWCRGARCGLRRLLVALALGLPACLALAYLSCFVPGRTIRLGPEAIEWAPASFHTATDRSTGLLSPTALVEWHYAHGFRVLNVSDRTNGNGAAEAVAAGRAYADAGLLVLAGQAWHGSPDLVFVNLHDPVTVEAGDIAGAMARARSQGAAGFLAHPWDKLDIPLDDALQAGVDGVEAFNGELYGGSLVLETAVRRGKALLGTLDYQFGPHVTALTLIPDKMARTPDGVVRALREARTRVVYAVAGGARTGETWKAGAFGFERLSRAFAVLRAVPHPRRAVWFLQLALIPLLWWFTTRPRQGAPRRGPGAGGARKLFALLCAVELALPALISWRVREILGTVPVELVLALAALVAVPLLATTHRLACAQAASEDDAGGTRS